MATTVLATTGQDLRTHFIHPAVRIIYITTGQDLRTPLTISDFCFIHTWVP